MFLQMVELLHHCNDIDVIVLFTSGPHLRHNYHGNKTLETMLSGSVELVGHRLNRPVLLHLCVCRVLPINNATWCQEWDSSYRIVAEILECICKPNSVNLAPDDRIRLVERSVNKHAASNSSIYPVLYSFTVETRLQGELSCELEEI